MENVVFFSGGSHPELSKSIANKCGKELSPIEIVKFADGESKPELGENVRGRTVIIIQSTYATPESATDNFMMVTTIADAAKRASAKEIILVAPYHGFSRQERKDKPRTPITAKLIARFLETAGINRLITMDLHADAIQGFYEIPVDNLYASYVFEQEIQKILKKDSLFASPDIGGTKRVGAYSEYFDRDFIICYKRRKKPNQIDEIIKIVGNPKGKHIILIDDIIDTAGTICRESEVLHEKGAKSITVFASHGVLSGNAYTNIMKAQINRCIISDSHPKLLNDRKNGSDPCPKVEVFSCADMFAHAITNHINKESIKSLFKF